MSARQLIRWSVSICCLTTLAIAQPTPTAAHGIVGNRVFPGTLAFEDPAVMDEFVLTGTGLKHSDDEGNVLDNAISWQFSRLLTSTTSVGIGSGFIRRDWDGTRRSGFDETELNIKTLLYQSDLHEVMISAGLAGGIGRTGAMGVGANQFTTIQPGVFFEKALATFPTGWPGCGRLQLLAQHRLKFQPPATRRFSIIQCRANSRLIDSGPTLSCIWAFRFNTAHSTLRLDTPAAFQKRNR